MFYNIIKNFFLKKNVTKKLATQNSSGSNDKVLTVGVLVDETYFNETSQLVERIVSQGIQESNISILVYKDKIKKKEVINEPFLSLKNISISGEINKKPAWNALFAAIQVFLYLQYIHIFHILLTHIRLVP